MIDFVLLELLRNSIFVIDPLGFELCGVDWTYYMMTGLVNIPIWVPNASICDSSRNGDFFRGNTRLTEF